MVQTLEIISVNLWNILISLANLALLFWLIKKFLYKPVLKMLAEREGAISKQYQKAEEAEQTALHLKSEWEEKMQTAEEEATAILDSATEKAQARSEKIVSEAREKAAHIVEQAESDATLEKKKAEADIKKEIVVISAALSEKLLKREIKENDHRELIHAFLAEIGEEHEGNE
ncbi:MAG: F0F1 ATP synthase subunit B [Clostridia bacterium]|nr:F0F1 ATP synthase subunit B [Clostridia bacterium]